MKRRGRPVLGAFSGFFTGLFGALSLLFNGVIPLESPLLVVLPIGLMILVWALAMWGAMPTKKSKAAAAAMAAPAAPASAPASSGTDGAADSGGGEGDADGGDEGA